ncbi:MAG TPA: FKBP-type peptidyl-prolyl cis-trans isomerase [Candidatus Sulfotelmatobacter sp.]|nr:FKBP-type peptidyl-prolyl cis-trans isomerase [Candidatus Sulfotelmatobacter sp.]
MQKSFTIALQLVAAGLMLLGNAPAQSTPAASSSQSSATSGTAGSGQATSAKKTTSTAAKKPGATTAKTAAAPVVLKTEKEKQSYAMGMNLGLGLHKQGMTLDPALVARGMKDSMSGGKTALTEEEARTVIQQLNTEVHQRMDAKAKEAAAGNRKAGEEFLAQNKSKEGVVTTPSGLQYKILTAGNGPKPTASDTVSCNYRGTLIDGKEFDSSYKRGQPASFPVSGVIKGWTEALQLMPVGSKWQLFIPPDLAYGDKGAGADIGPDETLIFEVELLSIADKK